MSIAKIPIFGAEPYGFKATDVTGCRAWFDAADVTSLYSTLPVTGMLGFTDYASADEQRVTVWEDKSIGGNDMIRNLNPTNLNDTSSNYMGPPIRAPDVSNLTALAVVNFDQGNNTGSGDAGGDSNAPSFLQQNLVAVGTYTSNEAARGPRVGTGISATTDIFVVVKPKFLTVAGDVFSIGTRTSPQGTQDFTCLSITSSGYWKINSQAGARDVTSANAEVFDTFSNFRGADPNYRILHMSLSNNNYILRRNGSQIGSENRTWSPTLENYRYYMGRRNASSTPGNYFNGNIGEICVYNQILTTEKRTIVESYLAGKWNLIDLLPTDHPAKLKNIPFFLAGRSLAEAPNGFVRRAKSVKIYVQPPEAPNINETVISFGGATFTVSWPYYTGGSPDYYNVTIRNSTDDSTWSIVQYKPRFNLTSIVYTIGSVDNKYYQAIIESKNYGGSASTTSESILNSVPAPPSPSIPTTTGTSDLAMTWTPVYPGGDPQSYTIYLFISTNNGSTFTQTDTYSDIAFTNYTVTEKCVLFEQYKFKVTATNTIGTSAQSAFSSTFTYNGAGS